MHIASTAAPTPNLHFLRLMSTSHCSYAQLVEHTKCTSLTQLDALLEDVERQGGEGLMIRQPGSKYVSGR